MKKSMVEDGLTEIVQLNNRDKPKDGTLFFWFPLAPTSYWILFWEYSSISTFSNFWLHSIQQLRFSRRYHCSWFIYWWAPRILSSNSSLWWVKPECTCIKDIPGTLPLRTSVRWWISCSLLYPTSSFTLSCCSMSRISICIRNRSKS